MFWFALALLVSISVLAIVLGWRQIQGSLYRSLDSSLSEKDAKELYELFASFFANEFADLNAFREFLLPKEVLLFRRRNDNVLVGFIILQKKKKTLDGAPLYIIQGR